MNIDRLPALRAWWKRSGRHGFDGLAAAAAWEAAARYEASPPRREQYLARACEILEADPVALLDVMAEEGRHKPRAVEWKRAARGAWT